VKLGHQPEDGRVPPQGGIPCSDFPAFLLSSSTIPTGIRPREGFRRGPFTTNEPASPAPTSRTLEGPVSAARRRKPEQPALEADRSESHEA
jgi:hypothetical protein